MSDEARDTETGPTTPPSPPTEETPMQTRTQRPPFDPVALVVGIVFTVLAVIALLDAETARRIDVGTVWAATFVAVGAALLATTLRGRSDDGGQSG